MLFSTCSIRDVLVFLKLLNMIVHFAKQMCSHCKKMSCVPIAVCIFIVPASLKLCRQQGCKGTLVFLSKM